mmetsp:Transcript_36340/g.48723  ORF Transcript_36340/g.48723 Transcript_36340/m.48723 type:complete len:107 (+) Transcript_36340:281-601(+)
MKRKSDPNEIKALIAKEKYRVTTANARHLAIIAALSCSFFGKKMLMRPMGGQNSPRNKMINPDPNTKTFNKGDSHQGGLLKSMTGINVPMSLSTLPSSFVKNATRA